MKKSCKNINLRDPTQLDPWIRDCIGRHYDRKDFIKLMENYGCAAGYYSPLQQYNDMIYRLGERVVWSIENHQLALPPVRIGWRKDGPTGKLRQIGQECAMQQIYDYVVRGASQEIWNRRLVPQQASSIKDRGPLYGIKIIKGWVDANNAQMEYCKRHGIRYTNKCKYHAKLDSVKCFPSGNKDKFLMLFERDCANEDLIWLWDALLASHHVNGYSGFLIGALPSEWAMQYMISFLYREIKSLHDRKGNTMISHALWYMDDATIIGANRKNMKTAINHIIDYAHEKIGQTIHDNWSIQPFKDHPINSMGYLLYNNGKLAIRDRDFVRARRIILRGADNGLSLRQARRIMSYKGYFDHSSYYTVNRTLAPGKTYAKARAAFHRNKEA